MKAITRCVVCNKEIEVWVKNNEEKRGWYCGDCAKIGLALIEKVIVKCGSCGEEIEINLTPYRDNKKEKGN